MLYITAGYHRVMYTHWNGTNTVPPPHIDIPIIGHALMWLRGRSLAEYHIFRIWVRILVLAEKKKRDGDGLLTLRPN